jgi:hypothetical protein
MDWHLVIVVGQARVSAVVEEGVSLWGLRRLFTLAPSASSFRTMLLSPFAQATWSADMSPPQREVHLRPIAEVCPP